MTTTRRTFHAVITYKVQHLFGGEWVDTGHARGLTLGRAQAWAQACADSGMRVRVVAEDAA